jgi:DNA-binding MarR family transcriptional regulator
MQPIVIKTALREYFKAALTSLKPLPLYRTLRNREVEVLSELYYHNYLNKYIHEDKRNKIVFDSSTKKEIAEYLEMPMSSVDNNISILKERGFIIGIRGGKILNPRYVLDPEKDPKIIYEFSINNND